SECGEQHDSLAGQLHGETDSASGSSCFMDTCFFPPHGDPTPTGATTGNYNGTSASCSGFNTSSGTGRSSSCCSASEDNACSSTSMISSGDSEEDDRPRPLPQNLLLGNYNGGAASYLHREGYLGNSYWPTFGAAGQRRGSRESVDAAKDTLRYWYEGMVRSFNEMHGYTSVTNRRPPHVLFETGGKTELAGAYPLMKTLARQGVRVTLLAPFGKFASRNSSLYTTKTTTSKIAGAAPKIDATTSRLYSLDPVPNVDAPVLPERLMPEEDRGVGEDYEDPEQDRVAWDFGLPVHDWRALEEAGVTVVPLKPRDVIHNSGWLFAQQAKDSKILRWSRDYKFTEKFIAEYILGENPVDFVISDCYAAGSGVAKTLMETLRVPGSIWCGNFHGAWAARWVLDRTMRSSPGSNKSPTDFFPTFVQHFLPSEVTKQTGSCFPKVQIRKEVEGAADESLHGKKSSCSTC
ncbi:unnamed protein product, partial [Amoebophrya sp. A120]